jgi:hypothetical protein
MEMCLSRLLLIVAAALPLGACMTAAERAQEIAASDDAACRNAGTKPGTPAYVQCREAKSNQRAMARIVEDQAMQRQMHEMMRPPM